MTEVGDFELKDEELLDFELSDCDYGSEDFDFDHEQFEEECRNPDDVIVSLDRSFITVVSDSHLETLKDDSVSAFPSDLEAQQQRIVSTQSQGKKEDVKEDGPTEEHSKNAGIEKCYKWSSSADLEEGELVDFAVMPEPHHEAVVNVDAKEDSNLHQVKKRKNCYVAERKHTLGTVKTKEHKREKDQTPKSLAHHQSKHSSRRRNEHFGVLTNARNGARNSSGRFGNFHAPILLSKAPNIRQPGRPLSPFELRANVPIQPVLHGFGPSLGTMKSAENILRTRQTLHLTQLGFQGHQIAMPRVRPLAGLEFSTPVPMHVHNMRSNTSSQIRFVTGVNHTSREQGNSPMLELNAGPDRYIPWQIKPMLPVNPSDLRHVICGNIKPSCGLLPVPAMNPSISNQRFAKLITSNACESRKEALPSGGMSCIKRRHTSMTAINKDTGDRGVCKLQKQHSSSTVPTLTASTANVIHLGGPVQKSRVLTVGGLNEDMPMSSVIEVFERQGKIMDLRKSERGNTFIITFANVHEAISAKRRLHRSFITGQQITVDFAV